MESCLKSNHWSASRPDLGRPPPTSRYIMAQFADVPARPRHRRRPLESPEVPEVVLGGPWEWPRRPAEPVDVTPSHWTPPPQHQRTAYWEVVEASRLRPRSRSRRCSLRGRSRWRTTLESTGCLWNQLLPYDAAAALANDKEQLDGGAAAAAADAASKQEFKKTPIKLHEYVVRKRSPFLPRNHGALKIMSFFTRKPWCPGLIGQE